MLFSPAYLFLHLLLSEVQCQEVEVLGLFPLSGARQEMVSTRKDGARQVDVLRSVFL